MPQRASALRIVEIDRDDALPKNIGIVPAPSAAPPPAPTPTVRTVRVPALDDRLHTHSVADEAVRIATRGLHAFGREIFSNCAAQTALVQRIDYAAPGAA